MKKKFKVIGVCKLKKGYDFLIEDEDEMYYCCWFYKGKIKIKKI